MEFSNGLQRYLRQSADSGGPHRESFYGACDTLLLLLGPMTPHVTAEAWERRHGEGARLHAQPWPQADPGLARTESVTMVVQVDGKVRDRIEVDPEITEEEARGLALSSERVVEALGGAEPTRVIVRPPRLVNLVR
jgi:leucyl-tRNA synthetase